MQQWLQADQLGSAQYTPSVLSTKEIQSRLASIDKTQRERSTGSPAGSTLPSWVLRTTAAQNLSSSMGPSLDSKFQAAVQTTLGSQWESQLVTPNMLQMAGLDPTAALRGGSHDAGHGVAPARARLAAREVEQRRDRIAP